jgi:hypothetical protein
VLQGALLGVVGLVLAFGLSLAVSRYEDRRASIVVETNAIGTTWLRAQTLPEPQRSSSLELLRDYTESAIRFADYVPGSDEANAAAGDEEAIQRRLWGDAGEALDERPKDSAPRLYVETLNEMIDAQTTRAAALNNRVPDAVLILEVVGAAIALGLLGAYMTVIGRQIFAVLLVAVLVAFLVLVICDLDRPTRGLIQVPDAPLRSQLASMELPPAAGPPSAPGQGRGP